MHIKLPGDKEDELKRELGKWSSEELWETDEGTVGYCSHLINRYRLYRTVQD